MKINLIILTINTYIIYKSGQLIYSANKVISLYKQDYPIVYFVPNRTVIKKKKQTIRRNKEVKSKLIKKVIKNVFSNILNHPYYLCFSKNQITSTSNSFNLSKSSSVFMTDGMRIIFPSPAYSGSMPCARRSSPTSAPSKPKF